MVLRGGGASLFGPGTDEGEEQPVLFLYIDFSVRERNIRGYIAMLMDLPSLAALKGLIADFIARIMADDPVPASASAG